MKKLEQLVRPNILSLEPYHSARQEFKGSADIFLDANESPYNNPLNRYPDPLQLNLKQHIGAVKGVATQSIFLGNGSDEAIDLIFRVFCVPGCDNVVGFKPSYGMYEVCADINAVEYRKALLNPDFSLNPDNLLKLVNGRTKVIFLCSPNNPTGNSLDPSAVESILRQFDGIVVVDEAYADFSGAKPFRTRLAEFPNLIVLNTFSKAWSHAAIRLGMAFAAPAIIALLNKIKYPYNINSLTAQAALKAVKEPFKFGEWIRLILNERNNVMSAVRELRYCRNVFPTDSNFFLARFDNAERLYLYLKAQGIVVRNRSHEPLCEGCLRFTIGTPTENNRLVSALRCYQP